MSLNNQPKTDEFRNYLEKTGVVDQLTRVLVSLYEENEKPENALEYIFKSDSLEKIFLQLMI